MQKTEKKKCKEACGALCVHDTSAGFELLGQNFADLGHPRGFNLRCWSLGETNDDAALTVMGFLLHLSKQ